MRFGLSVLATLMISCLHFGAASAQDNAAVKNELEAQYQNLADAHERQDLKAIVGLKTADFHAIFPDGRVGDSKLMEQYSKRFLESNNLHTLKGSPFRSCRYLRMS
jgi:hypothetical protein